ARQGQRSVAARAGDGVQARRRGRAVGRAQRSFAPQRQRPGYDVPGFFRRALGWAKRPKAACPPYVPDFAGDDATLRYLIDLNLFTSSASAPANGWNVKRTV